MKNVLSILLALVFVLGFCAIPAYADGSNLLESFHENEYMYQAINLPQFSADPAAAPSDAELAEMLDFAMTSGSAHTLTASHFVVIRDLEEQKAILEGLSAFGFENPATEGTVLVLVLADTLRDQEHHAAPYNGWYSQMYYGIYEAGSASAYFILAAQTLGYSVHTVAGLNIPLEDTGEVQVMVTGGNFDLVTGNYWDINKYLTSKDGAVDFTHTIAMPMLGEPPQEIVAKGNLNLVSAIMIGKPAAEFDAVSSATKAYPVDMANYNFWDPQDGVTYGNHVAAGDEVAVNAPLDFSAVPDGTYSGIADDLHGEITINVTVADGKVIAIEADEASRSIMIGTDEQLNEYFTSIIAAQSMNVDGISGATTETKAIKEAIANALLADQTAAVPAFSTSETSPFQANSVAGLLSQYLTASDAEGAVSLFAPDAVISLPQKGKNGISVSDFKAYLEERFSESAKTFYLLNSPFYSASEDGALQASYYLLGLQVSGENQTVFGTRYDLEFVENDGTVQISGMNWYDMLSIAPESGAQLCADFTPVTARILQNDEAQAEADKVLGRSVQEKLVESTDAISIYYSPVYTAGENGIECSYLTLEFVRAEDGSAYTPSLYYDVFSFADTMEPVTHEKLAEFAPLVNIPENQEMAEAMIARKIVLPLPEQTDITLSEEDIVAIENAGAHWVGAIRSCDPSTFVQYALDDSSDELAVDVIEPISGMEGFQDQFEQMAAMHMLQPKKQGIHTIAVPYIEAIDQDHAVAIWMDFGWTMMGELFGNEGDFCPVMPDVGRYIMKLHRVGDDWKVYDLNWGPVVQYGMWGFTQDASIGWAAEEGTESWPSIIPNLG